MKTKLHTRSPLLAFAAIAALLPLTPLAAQNDGAASTDRASEENIPAPETAQPLDLNPKLVQAEPLKGDQEKLPKTDLGIATILSGSKDFTTLVAALKAADLTEILKGSGSFTVFAPNNAAFAALPEGVLPMLLQPDHRKMLIKVLKYHVLTQKLKSGDFVPGPIKTVEGEPLTFVGGEKGVIMLQGSRLGTDQVVAKNGIIHPIDQVLIPPSVVIEKPTVTSTEKLQPAPE